MTMQNLLQQCRKKSHSKVLRFWVVLAAVALLLALACRGYDWDALGRYKGDNISSLHYVRGRVVEVLRDDTKPDQLDPARSMGTQELRILLLEGANKGTEVTIANYLTRTQNVRLRQGETAIICEDLPDSADAYYTVSSDCLCPCADHERGYDRYPGAGRGSHPRSRCPGGNRGGRCPYFLRQQP